MESELMPWLLQQFTIAYTCNIACIVTDYGIGHNCQLGKESGRQIERRYGNRFIQLYTNYFRKLSQAISLTLKCIKLYIVTHNDDDRSIEWLTKARHAAWQKQRRKLIRSNVECGSEQCKCAAWEMRGSCCYRNTHFKYVWSRKVRVYCVDVKNRLKNCRVLMLCIYNVFFLIVLEKYRWFIGRNWNR